VGGMLALGSQHLNRLDDLILAEQITYSCYLSYNGTATGIGPEVFSWSPTVKQAGLGGSGFAVDIPAYYLRPETVESLFYLYRYTGNTTYQVTVRSR